MGRTKPYVDLTVAHYQRLGFRMRSVERDAFTAATGYGPGLDVDGIELRDRVWLDVRPRALTMTGTPVAGAAPRAPASIGPFSGDL